MHLTNKKCCGKKNNHASKGCCNCKGSGGCKPAKKTPPPTPTPQ